MALFEGRYFGPGEVRLDGHQFRGCDFVDVTLRFDAVEGFEMDDQCSFRGAIRLQLSPLARMALVTLANMQRHSQFGPLIEKMIDRERRIGPDAFD